MVQKFKRRYNFGGNYERKKNGASPYYGHTLKLNVPNGSHLIFETIRKSLFIVLLLLLSNCKEKTKDDSYVKYYYDTGELEYEISMKDSLLNGISFSYYKSGKKRNERYFLNDIPIYHHYYYSEEGKLLMYDFYDVRGQLRSQLFLDTIANSYSLDGKLLYIEGEFKKSYNQGDSISLIPIVANPFKTRYSVTLLTDKEEVSKSYDFNNLKSPLFLYILERGNNQIKIIGEVNGFKEGFRRDTILLELIGK